jgi:hypothetical protein
MDLVILFGPPAVGKMTVGREICRLTGYKLAYNHMTVEPLKDIFEFGTPPFDLLVSEFRRRIMEEAAAAGLPGLVQTFVWGLDLTEDLARVESWVSIIEGSGGTVHIAELYADSATRLARNGTPSRQDAKPTHRDQALSQAIFRALDSEYLMSTGVRPALADKTIAAHPHVRVDNTDLSPADTARRIVSELRLP